MVIVLGREGGQKLLGQRPGGPRGGAFDREKMKSILVHYIPIIDKERRIHIPQNTAESLLLVSSYRFLYALILNLWALSRNPFFLALFNGCRLVADWGLLM